MSQRGGSFRHLPRVSGAQIGRIAAITYVCPNCGRQYPAPKPSQCDTCGRMDFTRFDSKAEARWWAQLQQLEQAGKITNLRRQVSYDLKTINLDTDLVTVFARYVADMVYEENGQVVLLDVKGGITDVAALKLRCMEAQGLPVRVVK